MYLRGRTCSGIVGWRDGTGHKDIDINNTQAIFFDDITKTIL